VKKKNGFPKRTEKGKKKSLNKNTQINKKNCRRNDTHHPAEG
jgi:hypothetical protein